MKPQAVAIGSLVGFARAAKLAIGIMTWVSTATGHGQANEPEHLFHFGTSAALFRQFNENDAKAAMRVWAETLVSNGVIHADPTMRIYDSVDAITAALQKQELDGVSVPINELFAIMDKIQFDHFIFDVVEGSITERYVLLVPQNSEVTNLQALQGRSLNVLRNARMSLASIWLDTLLLEKGLEPSVKLCSQVTEDDKVTKTVLPVFFHRTDACLVTLKGFKTMCELNPQVERQLKTLAISPEFVVTGFFLRAGPPKALQDQVVAQTLRVHLAPAGQQILTVFHTDRLEEYPASVLDGSFALLRRHEQLLAKVQADHADTPGKVAIQDATSKLPK